VWPARKADNLIAIYEPIVWHSGYQPVVRVPLEVRGGPVEGTRK
jgi:hypothetical protein